MGVLLKFILHFKGQIKNWNFFNFFIYKARTILMVFLTILFLSFNLWSESSGAKYQPPFLSVAEPEAFVIDRDLSGQETNFIMHGKRFRGLPGAKPLVLAHGFLNTDESLEMWGRFFHALGYDVWIFNHLGFGIGERKSVVRYYRLGDYGFMNLLSGMDQVIRHVYHETGLPITYFSFSMGGMTIYQYLDGSYELSSSGIPLRSSILAQERQAMFEKLITNGAPAFDLTGLSLHMKFTAHLSRMLLFGPLKTASFWVPLGLGQGDEGMVSIGQIIAAAQKNVPDQVLAPLFTDFFHLPNVVSHHKDLAAVFDRMVSNPHTDILRSFAKMITSNTRIAAPELKIPNLSIIGSLDRLAPPNQLLRHHKELTAHNPNHRALLLAGFGHFDMMFPRAIELIRGDVVHYLQETEAFVAKTPLVLLKGPVTEREIFLINKFYNKINESKAPPHKDISVEKHRSDSHDVFKLPSNKNRCEDLFRDL